MTHKFFASHVLMASILGLASYRGQLVAQEPDATPDPVTEPAQSTPAEKMRAQYREHMERLENKQLYDESIFAETKKLRDAGMQSQARIVELIEKNLHSHEPKSLDVGKIAALDNAIDVLCVYRPVAICSAERDDADYREIFKEWVSPKPSPIDDQADQSAAPAADENSERPEQPPLETDLSLEQIAQITLDRARDVIADIRESRSDQEQEQKDTHKVSVELAFGIINDAIMLEKFGVAVERILNHEPDQDDNDNANSIFEFSAPAIDTNRKKAAEQRATLREMENAIPYPITDLPETYLLGQQANAAGYNAALGAKEILRSTRAAYFNQDNTQALNDAVNHFCIMAMSPSCPKKKRYTKEQEPETYDDDAVQKAQPVPVAPPLLAVTKDAQAALDRAYEAIGFIESEPKVSPVQIVPSDETTKIPQYVFAGAVLESVKQVGAIETFTHVLTGIFSNIQAPVVPAAPFVNRQMRPR